MWFKPTWPEKIKSCICLDFIRWKIFILTGILDGLICVLRGTLTGKVGNIHCLWFSSVTVKTTITFCGRRRKHGLKLQFSSWFSIHLLLHRLCRINYQINSIDKCVIIESNVLHQSVSYWESLSCKIFPLVFIA